MFKEQSQDFSQKRKPISFKIQNVDRPGFFPNQGKPISVNLHLNWNNKKPIETSRYASARQILVIEEGSADWFLLSFSCTNLLEIQTKEA